MARIMIEKKISIGNGVSEIKKIEYDIPDNIIYKGQYMSYDSYHQEYKSMHNDIFISATDYINCILSCNKQKSDNYINQDD